MPNKLILLSSACLLLLPACGELNYSDSTAATTPDLPLGTVYTTPNGQSFVVGTNQTSTGAPGAWVNPTVVSSSYGQYQVIAPSVLAVPTTVAPSVVSPLATTNTLLGGASSAAGLLGGPEGFAAKILLGAVQGAINGAVEAAVAKAIN